MTGPSRVERLLRPLDVARRACLAALIQWLQPLIVDRERRIAVTALFLMTIALFLAMSVPMWVLALGPIVWGVPHVIGDVRYLAIRSGYAQRRALWFAAGIPLVIAGCTAGVPWLTSTLRAGVVAGFLASLGALWVAHTTHTKRAIGTLVLGGLALVSYRIGYTADLIFAHAHNFVAIGLWWAWRRRHDNLHWFPLAFFALACGALMLGVASPFLATTGGLFWAPVGGDINLHLQALASGLPHHWGIRLVLVFAFAQSVHYIIWIRLIPEEDRPQPTPRTFASSYRALRDDFGSLPLLLAALFAVALLCWAIVDLMAARIGYLRLAVFHGHLELVAATLLWAEAGKVDTSISR